MWMAANQLLRAMLGHGLEVPRTSLLQEQRQKVDLKKHVSELVEQLAVVMAVGGVGKLVGLLDGVGNDGALVLLAIPRTFEAQLMRDLVEARDRCGRRL